MNYTFYRIYSKNPAITECYIGSTKDFNARKTQHIYDYNNYMSSKIYTYIRSNGGFDAFEFEIIDIITFSGNPDRFLHEEKLIQLYGATLNTHYSLEIKEKKDKKLLEQKMKKLEKEKKKAQILLEKQERTKNIQCECGLEYMFFNEYNHIKSREHILRLEGINWYKSKINPVLYGKI